jgi:ferric-dicitrate binding protein FerR (iron transport regulator)
MIDANDEEATARLLRLSGRRLDVPAERAARVRGAVHDVWKVRARRRAVRRGGLSALAILSAAAAIVFAVTSTTRHRQAPIAPPEIVAQVDRVEGHAALEPVGTAAVLSPGDAVRAGSSVRTGATGRTALRLSDGTSVRLDADGLIRFVAPRVIELTRGTVYFDTGRSAAGLEIRTALGTIRDVGTQFEVHLRASSLRLRVRTGVAELRRGAAVVPARAGTELTIAEGDVVSRAVPTYGPGWDWSARLAGPFEIEGRPLAAFLEDLSHEHGWTLRYADAALARDASSIILHGSVSGLRPEEALAVALTTSRLSHRFSDGELLVVRSAEPQ